MASRILREYCSIPGTAIIEYTESVIIRDIKQAAEKLAEGEVVAFPTETVYGLGAAISQPLAIAKIYEMKRRPLDHPLIVHCATLGQVEELVREFPPKARQLAEAFWPGPLTLVLPKSDLVLDIISGGMDSIGIRIPANQVALDLIKAAQSPIAAPSANAFGEISPTTAEHVKDSFPNFPDLLVLDDGASLIGVESTIIGFLSRDPVCLRPGGLSLEKIEELIGPVKTPSPTAKAIAPGMLPQHYSPRTKMRFIEPGQPFPKVEGPIGILYFQSRPLVSAERDYALSTAGDLREAASRLYAVLRELDKKHLKEIWAFSVPDQELGRAINDRLRRAASKRD